MNIARCKGCNREIVWTESPDGKPMPIDRRPVTVYAVAVEGATTKAKRVRHIDADGQIVERVHLSHFVTCPNREEFSSGTHRNNQAP